MQFLAYTLRRGRVESRRRHNTDSLVPAGILIGQHMLHQLRQQPGAMLEIPQLPQLAVRLRMPPQFGDQPCYAQMFTVEVVGRGPLLFNAVLEPRTDDETAVAAISTMVGLSFGADGLQMTAAEFEEMVGPLSETRPLLATVQLPVLIDARTVERAREFATVFAAAWLLEAGPAA